MNLEQLNIRRAKWTFMILFALAASPVAFAGNITLEGENKGDTVNWYAGNLQNWQELDYIPCRVRFNNSLGSNQVITLNFEHVNNQVPGIQNLFDFTNSANVVFAAAPVLSAPPGASVWSYTFTVNVL